MTKKNITTAENRKYSPVSTNTLKETEKAWYLSIAYWTKAEDKKLKEAKMWVPKSCAKAENGTVTEVAEFILNKWVEEHNNYLRTFGHRLPNISFDLAEKERLVNLAKQRDEEAKEYRKNALNALYNETLPFVNKFMSELGGYCSAYAAYYRQQNAASEDFTNRLEDLGKRINKLYPVDEAWKEKVIAGFTKDRGDDAESYRKAVDNWFWEHGYNDRFLGDWRMYSNFDSRQHGFTQQDVNDFYWYYNGRRQKSLCKSPLGRKFGKQYKLYLEFISMIDEFFGKED